MKLVYEIYHWLLLYAKVVIISSCGACPEVVFEFELRANHFGS